MRTLILCTLMCVTMALAQAEIPLWTGDMPGKATIESEVSVSSGKSGVLRISIVSTPTLTLFLLKDGSPDNPFVIVCPGGGYNLLAFDKEGTEIASWLNSIGVSAAVLKYRVPNNRQGALEDARKAVRMARENATAWNIDPKHIGMMGFSAGGHLTAACSNSPDRPDFSVLVYPAYLFKEGGIELNDDIQVDSNTPPAFVVQTQDDKKYYRSTLAYTAALDAAGINVECHLFAKGGHGYGLRNVENPVSLWPKLCEAWMRDTGILRDNR